MFLAQKHRFRTNVRNRIILWANLVVNFGFHQIYHFLQKCLKSPKIEKNRYFMKKHEISHFSSFLWFLWFLIKFRKNARKQNRKGYVKKSKSMKKWCFFMFFHLFPSRLLHLSWIRKICSSRKFGLGPQNLSLERIIFLLQRFSLFWMKRSFASRNQQNKP